MRIREKLQPTRDRHSPSSQTCESRACDRHSWFPDPAAGARAGLHVVRMGGGDPQGVSTGRRISGSVPCVGAAAFQDVGSKQILETWSPAPWRNDFVSFSSSFETDDGSSKFIKPVDQDQLVHRLRGSSTFPFDLLGSKSFSRTLRRLSSLIQGTFRSSSIFSKYCNARFFLRQSDFTWCCA